MIPFELQDAPRVFPTSASATGAPPASESRFSFPSEEKPIDWPSGDQNGPTAPSVFGSGLDSNSETDRTQRFLCRLASMTPKTLRVPSGEITAGATRLSSSIETRKRTPSGGVNSNETPA